MSDLERVVLMGKLPVLCQRVDYVKSLEQQGVGIFRNACRSAEGDRCEFMTAAATI